MDVAVKNLVMGLNPEVRKWYQNPSFLFESLLILLHLFNSFVGPNFRHLIKNLKSFLIDSYSAHWVIIRKESMVTVWSRVGNLYRAFQVIVIFFF